MASFYGWGSTASRLEPLRGGSLLFTTKFPKTIDTIDSIILRHELHTLLSENYIVFITRKQLQLEK